MNTVHLLGNLGDKIELKRFENGGVVGNVSMATNKTYKNSQGQKVDKTEWHRLVFSGKSAEIIEKYTDKGDRLLVSGEIQYRSYKVGEETKYITEIFVNTFEFVSTKSNTNASASESSPSDNADLTDKDDDLPF